MKHNRSTGIVLKSRREIEIMREANIHVAEILRRMCDSVEPGITTWDIDQIARQEVEARNLKSAFLGYRGFPAMVCISINEEIVHGIPSKQRIVCEGDIVSLDFGVVYKGYVGDCALTVPAGKISDQAENLMRVTQTCLDKAIQICTPHHRLSDIGRVVQAHAESYGYGVVREFVGHGIGTQMHEEPQIPNYYDRPRPRMKPGLVIAIEPMINLGTYEVEVLSDGWTAVTKDRKLSAHFEHSVAITEDKPIVLSQL